MTQELSEKIEAYIEGALSGADLTDFENTLKSDQELAQEVTLQKELLTYLQHNEKSIAFRKKLQVISEEIKKENSHKTSTVTKKSFTYFKIAASFLVLIGLSTFLWFNTGNTTPEDLYAQYYVTYPIGDIKRGAEISEDIAIKDIIVQYKNGEYQKVIKPLESIVASNPNNERLRLCLGNCYLNTNQLDKAETIFTSITSDSVYHSDAKWFLSLTYLKKEETNKMIPLLEELSLLDNIHKQNSEKLLKDIKKLK